MTTQHPKWRSFPGQLLSQKPEKKVQGKGGILPETKQEKGRVNEEILNSGQNEKLFTRKRQNTFKMTAQKFSFGGGR